MDSRSRDPALAAPSRSGVVPLRCSRPYIFVNVLLVLALCTYFFYPQPTDREPQPFRTSSELSNCDPDEPVKRVAIIGTFPSAASLQVRLKTDKVTIRRRRLRRLINCLLPFQVRSTLPSGQFNHL